MLVLGIDAGLVRTGIAALEDGKIIRACTIVVEGDTKYTGPRYSFLRRALEQVALNVLKRKQPAVVAIDQPDEDEGEDGIREGHEKMDVAKLYGAYAVLFAEAERLWPKTRVVGATPSQWKGPYPKGLTVGRMAFKYGGRAAANQHEWDAVALADWAEPLAQVPKDLTRTAD
jgi:RNase H-fold protein (predicted Holliday junction resolvase)